MIVDCHTHVRSLSEAEVSEHLAAVEAVDACIVHAGLDGPPDQVNRKLSEYVDKHKDRMVGFATADPTRERIDERGLTSLTEKLGFRGVVLYCSMCGFHPAHSLAMRFYEAIQERGLPIFFHNGSHALSAEAVLEYAQPYLLDGNMGVPFVEQTLSMVGKHENVYADLTVRPAKVWQTYNMVVAAHERNVMEKLLFGSGFPLGQAGECIETLLGFNTLLGDTKLPAVPRGNIEHEQIKLRADKAQATNPPTQE